MSDYESELDRAEASIEDDYFDPGPPNPQSGQICTYSSHKTRILELEDALRAARKEINQMELADILVRNPGIDLDEVSRLRTSMGASRRLATIDKVLERP